MSVEQDNPTAAEAARPRAPAPGPAATAEPLTITATPLPKAAAEPAAKTGLRQKLRQLPKPVVNKEDWARLERVEQAEAAQRGLPEFKFSTNDEMLAAMGLVATA